jgi:hypothetical protein
VLLAIRYKDDLPIEPASHDGAIGSVADDLRYNWPGLVIVAKNLHGLRRQFDPHDIRMDETVGFVRDDDQHHLRVKIDPRASKERIGARPRRGHAVHDFDRYASNETMKALLISDNTLFLAKSNDVIRRRFFDEGEPQSLRVRP